MSKLVLLLLLLTAVVAVTARSYRGTVFRAKVYGKYIPKSGKCKVFGKYYRSGQLIRSPSNLKMFTFRCVRGRGVTLVRSKSYCLYKGHNIRYGRTFRDGCSVFKCGIYMYRTSNPWRKNVKSKMSLISSGCRDESGRCHRAGSKEEKGQKVCHCDSRTLKWLCLYLPPSFGPPKRLPPIPNPNVCQGCMVKGKCVKDGYKEEKKLKNTGMIGKTVCTCKKHKFVCNSFGVGIPLYRTRPAPLIPRLGAPIFPCSGCMLKGKCVKDGYKEEKKLKNTAMIGKTVCTCKKHKFQCYSFGVGIPLYITRPYAPPPPPPPPIFHCSGCMMKGQCYPPGTFKRLSSGSCFCLMNRWACINLPIIPRTCNGCVYKDRCYLPGEKRRSKFAFGRKTCTCRNKKWKCSAVGIPAVGLDPPKIMAPPPACMYKGKWYPLGQVRHSKVDGGTETCTCKKNDWKCTGMSDPVVYNPPKLAPCPGCMYKGKCYPLGHVRHSKVVGGTETCTCKKNDWKCTGMGDPVVYDPPKLMAPPPGCMYKGKWYPLGQVRHSKVEGGTETCTCKKNDWKCTGMSDPVVSNPLKLAPCPGCLKKDGTCAKEGERRDDGSKCLCIQNNWACP